MLNLTDLNYNEISELVRKFNQPAFRALQLYKWINNGADFNEMSDLPVKFKAELEKEYCAKSMRIIETLTSKDGSEKYLYKLNDGNIVEGVFMPHNYGNTICVSTQVGCRMNCSFCASGIGGLERNLTCGEILEQVILINSIMGGNIEKRQLSNIVLMGSGEPLDNYENVTKFIDLVTFEKGLNFSQRSISLSTCGLADKIIRLADDGYSVTLSVSLHATTDESRQELMPVAKKFSLKILKEAVLHYFNKTGRRVIFEYALVKEKNMNFHDAKRLSEFTKGYPSHVNLIMLNPVKEKNIKGCTQTEADRFLEKLTKMNISATIRKSQGGDIGGACGQLRAKFVGCETTTNSGHKD